MKIPKLQILAGLLYLACCNLYAADLYVAPSGDDNTGTGTLGAPFRTIQKAANLAVAGDNVIIRAGTYRETVTPANSGTAAARITYKAYESGGVYENVIISGNDLVTGWTAHDTSGGRRIYKSNAMNWNLSDTHSDFGTIYRNQIFVNDNMMVLARWPNVPAERITRLTYEDLALVTAGSDTSSTSTSAWIENANINSTFGAGYWNPTRSATARVFLSPSTMIWGMSVKISSQSGNRLNLDATNTAFSFTTKYYAPTTNNRFFIYDWYDALDTANEFWKDTSTNTLYLWAPNGVDPSTLNVEAKRRDFALLLDNRQYLSFRGIKIFASTVTSNFKSKNLEFDEIDARYIAHFDNYAPTFNTSANSREFFLQGDGHVVENSYFFGSASSVIGANGTNISVENNVIRDFGYAHNGSAVHGRIGQDYGNRTIATKNQFIRNTAFNSGHQIIVTDPAIDVKHNRIYNSHLRGSDIGAVGICCTDGLGAEISYNVISDALGPKDNGVLYGGFGIYFDYECLNYTVHHNLVWNTTASSFQLMPIRAAQAGGATNAGMQFYNNTGTKSFGIISPQELPGVDIRNNLVSSFFFQNLPNVTFSNNTAFDDNGGPSFRDMAKGDLRFVNSSSAGIDAGAVIPSYTQQFNGPAPDTGALEFDQSAFIAGATVTERQLKSLTVTKIGQTGNAVDLQLANLPEGRGPSNDFQVQIGNGPFNGTLAYDYNNSTWKVLNVDKANLTGTQSISLRIGNSGTPVTLSSQVDVGSSIAGPEIAVRGGNYNLADGDATPSASDQTLFSDVQMGNTEGATQSFTIHNFGSATLNIGSINFTGANPTDFSLVNFPAATLAAGAQTSFSVRFLPSATGSRSAVIHIVNNDPDESDFDFVIQGNATAAQPLLNLPTPQLTATIAANSTGEVNLPIQNIGLGSLNWSLATSSGTNLYTWEDSENGGPAFNWYDIQNQGTQHWSTNSNDNFTTVTLPFSFPYYGSNFTELTIGVNGILAPGSPAILDHWDNLALPSSSAPINLIAAFWDDLFVDGSAQVRSHAVDANTFVVLYDNVKLASSNTRITFQVVLRSNGEITMQYADNQIPGSYTIGIQNAARDLGPQIGFSTQTGPIQGLQLPVGTGIDRAITFFPSKSFITSLSPASGTIAQNSSSLTTVNLSSSNFALGTHQTMLTLTSNDVRQPRIQVPVTLQVVASLPAPVVTASQSKSGIVGSALSYQILASNSPASYARASGTLPPGVTLNTTTGILSGTPTTAGTYTPAITATNATGTSASVVVAISIVAPAPIVTANQIGEGLISSAFSYQIMASSSPTLYTLSSGVLPAGVTLNTATGVLSGTPTASGSYSVAITATNGTSTSPVVMVTLVIDGTPIITSGQSPTGTVGSPLSYQLLAINAPSSYALVGGSLPAGVSFNTGTGLLSGTPTAAGSYTPIFTATSARGTSQPVVLTMNIAVAGSLIMHEAFNYAIGLNAPDPDGGLNNNRGLPATNIGGVPIGKSTGLFGTWGAMTDVAAGLTYSQGAKLLQTAGGSGAPNNATWGSSPTVYRDMSSDPFLAQRLGGANNTGFGIDGSSLYFSLLVRTSSASQSAWRMALNGSTNRNIFIENTASGWSLNENGAGPIASTSSLSLNTTTLLVVRIDFVAGAGDVFRLYVNPTLGAPLGTANATLTTSVDFTGFVSPNMRPSVQGAMILDELRMGTTFDIVTPFTQPPAAPVVLAGQSINGKPGKAIIYQVAATNTPTSYALASGSLPPNVTLDTTTGMLSGTPSAVGTYSPTITATNAGGTSTATTVMFTITGAASGLDLFRSNNGLSGTGSQDGQALAGDEVPNLAKYAFNMLGGGTGQAASLATPNSSTLTPSGNAGLPLIGIQSGSGKLQITYIRHKATATPLPGITYTVEFSEDLINWSVNNAATEAITNIDSALERVLVTDSDTTPVKRFVRVRINVL